MVVGKRKITLSSSASAIVLVGVCILAFTGLTRAELPTGYAGQKGGTEGIVHLLEQNGISAETIDNVSTKRQIVGQNRPDLTTLKGAPFALSTNLCLYHPLVIPPRP